MDSRDYVKGFSYIPERLQLLFKYQVKALATIRRLLARIKKDKGGEEAEKIITRLKNEALFKKEANSTYIINGLTKIVRDE